MTWAGAAVVATVGSGVASSRAATKAADKAAEGSDAQQAASRELIADSASLARRDVQRIFPQAQGDLLSGAAGAVDILGQGVTEQQRLLSAGNVGAQQTLGQGFGNIQNALLGLPINQQAFAPQGIELSQPIVNPIGKALGGGQVEGGLFSNLGQNIAEGKTEEDDFQRIQNLVDRVQTPGDVGRQRAAQAELARQGFDGRGRPVTPEIAQQLTEKFKQQDINRLVQRAKNQTGEGKASAIRGLELRGLDQFGNPL